MIWPRKYSQQITGCRQFAAKATFLIAKSPTLTDDTSTSDVLEYCYATSKNSSNYSLRINPSKQIYGVKAYAHFKFWYYLEPGCRETLDWQERWERVFQMVETAWAAGRWGSGSSSSGSFTSVCGGWDRMPHGTSGASSVWGLSYQCSGCLFSQRI